MTRVNSLTISNFINKEIIVLGKLKNNNILQIDHKIQIQLIDLPKDFQNFKFIEIHGIYLNNFKISCKIIIPFKFKIDFEIIDNLINFQEKYSNFFLLNK